MKTIILDTSFVVACAEFGIDYHTELRRIIDEKYSVELLDRTVDELNALVAQGGKKARAAKLARTLLQRKNIPVVKTQGRQHVDDLIQSLAQPSTYLVATIDAELKRRLHARHVGVVVIRQKKYLALE